jgi:uncharacterized membrane protein YsdA (DUF1294 family)
MSIESLIPTLNIITLTKVYLGASFITAILFIIDKQLAVNRSHRISEKNLFLASLFCGWPGGLLAMKIVRHKTQKGSFQVMMGLAVFVNVAFVAWLLLNINQI